MGWNGRKNITSEDVISRFRSVHGDKYDYSLVDYRGASEKVLIGCKRHGFFGQEPRKHWSGQGCPRCRKVKLMPYRANPEEITVVSESKYRAELEICDYLSNFIPSDDIVRHDSSVIPGGYEIDIYIPSRRVGIEFNVIRWSSEQFGKGRFYHYDKMERCREKGIRLIQIFEDEYNDRKEVVMSKLLHILGLDYDLQRIPARKCIISEIDKSVARWFLDNNHVEGYTNCTVALGCQYSSVIIGVMTFWDTGREGEWVMSRFATDNSLLCQGVGGRMFRYFTENYGPESVKCLVDRRWTFNADDNLMTRMGFAFDVEVPPDYMYVTDENPDRRISKFDLRKKELHRKYDLSMLLTETQVAKALGLSKVWDCGQYRYKWKKNPGI